MEIESIQIGNFQCYSGKPTQNVFQFGPGLNLVIGDNNAGKSKLFNAFFWVLYEKVFDSDLRDFIKMSPAFVSDKAKHEATIGSKIETDVILTALHRPPAGGLEVAYRYHRKFEITKIGINEFETGPFSFKCSKRQVGKAWETLSIDDEERAVSMIAPERIKRYLWFMGEALEKVIDFKNSESVTDAIETLSDIETYDRLIEICEAAYESGKKDYNKESRLHSSDENKAKLLEQRTAEIEKSLEQNQELLFEATNSYEFSRQKFDDKIHLLAGAQEIVRLDSDINGINTRLRQLVEAQKDLSQKYPGFLFQKKWIFRNAKPLLNKFIEKYELYHKKHLSKIAIKEADDSFSTELAKRGLSINEPSPVYLKKMLEDEICLICLRKAEKGTDAWNSMARLIPDEAPDKKQLGNELFHNDFSEFLKKLYRDALTVNRQVDDIDASITQTNSELQSLESSIRNTEDQLEKKKTERSNFLMGSDSGESANNLVKEIDRHSKDMEKFSQDKKDYENKVTQLKAQLDSIATEKRGLVKKDAAGVLAVLDRKQQLLSDLFEVTLSTRDRVFDEIIQSLQRESNRHFGDMTRNNPSARGTIRLQKRAEGKYIPQIITDDDVVMGNINDANAVLMKLSILMAIISSKGRKSAIYPFIADAPTSKFGEHYTEGFYKTISGVYGQSIIMTYDFATDEGKIDAFINEMKSEDRPLGSVHVLMPKGSSQQNRSDLTVGIKRVHGSR